MIAPRFFSSQTSKTDIIGIMVLVFHRMYFLSSKSNKALNGTRSMHPNWGKSITQCPHSLLINQMTLIGIMVLVFHRMYFLSSKSIKALNGTRSMHPNWGKSITQCPHSLLINQMTLERRGYQTPFMLANCCQYSK